MSAERPTARIDDVQRVAVVPLVGHDLAGPHVADVDDPRDPRPLLRRKSLEDQLLSHPLGIDWGVAHQAPVTRSWYARRPTPSRVSGSAG